MRTSSRHDYIYWELECKDQQQRIKKGVDKPIAEMERVTYNQFLHMFILT